MGTDAGKVGALDDQPPDTLPTLIVPIAAFGGEDEVGAFLLVDALEQGDCCSGRQVTENLARRSVAAANDDPFARTNLLILGCLTRLDVAKEPFNVAGWYLGNPLVAEQRNNMMAQARDCELLGLRLHRLTLSLATLDVAAFRLIEVDECAHLHLAPLSVALFSRVVTDRCRGEEFLRLSPRLLKRLRAAGPFRACNAYRHFSAKWNVTLAAFMVQAHLQHRSPLQ